MDCGTTVREIAKQLVNSSKRVMVLTSAPVVAETIADVSWISHVMLGGVLRRLSGCLSGPLATEHLRNFAINTAFIGVSGITEAGITVADLSEAQLKAAEGLQRKMTKEAKRRKAEGFFGDTPGNKPKA